jgi:hypothetical protein
MRLAQLILQRVMRMRLRAADTPLSPERAWVSNGTQRG